MNRSTPLAERWRTEFGTSLQTLQTWPWLETLRTLGQRFREDRLGLTAGSLTFTTLISLVPLLTVMLAVFSAFPIFASFQDALQRYFLQSLVPPDIARPVLSALTLFATKASRLGSVGLVALVLTVGALMLTIDRSLNGIWRVKKPRPIAQRVLVYWAAVTLGPLVLGMSLTLTSYAISATKGFVGEIPGGVRLMLAGVEFLLLGAGMAGLFHYVPNTRVRWRHAMAGGGFVALGIEGAKKLLAWYLTEVPTYSVIYGAFATVPIFLVWLYLGWVIVLLGAVIAAYAPSLQLHMARWPEGPGSRFRLAVAVLRALAHARADGGRGRAASELSQALRTDALQIEPVLDALVEIDWVGRLDEAGEARHVLLCDPMNTPARPLLAQLLIEPAPGLGRFWNAARFDAMTMQDLIGAPGADDSIPLTPTLST